MMDGWRDGRKNVAANPIIMYRWWVVEKQKESGWDGVEKD